MASEPNRRATSERQHEAPAPVDEEVQPPAARDVRQTPAAVTTKGAGASGSRFRSNRN
jgi:hypothetical protein